MDKKEAEKYNYTSKPGKRNRNSNESSSIDVKRKKHKRKYEKSSDTEFCSNHRKKQSKHCKHNKKHKKEREQNVERDDSFDVPISLMNSNKEMAPMTQNEWEKKQSVMKRVFDESSGRYRLIKGDGEVIEEIVSKEKHKEINQQATRGDCIYFQTQLSTHLKK